MNLELNITGIILEYFLFLFNSENFIMDKVIVGMLTNLTFRVNDEIKIAAIAALGDFKATIEYNDAIIRIIDLCQDPNKEVAVSAINTLSKLAIYFMQTSLPEH